VALRGSFAAVDDDAAHNEEDDDDDDVGTVEPSGRRELSHDHHPGTPDRAAAAAEVTEICVGTSAPPPALRRGSCVVTRG
jgi:hypothetical protein